MLSKKIVEQFHNICPSERDEYQQKRPYVSSAFCQRRISASGLLPTRKIEATKALQFYGRIGDPIEQLISEIYDANEQLIISQYKLPQQLFPAGVDIGGKIDLIIEYDGEPLIIDVKTVGATEGTDYFTVTDEESKIIQNLIDTDFDNPDVIQGQQLFGSAGCSGCHLDTLKTGIHPTIPALSQQTIHPYTDLLLHDMGERLADKLGDFQASGSEWRTPPLWGVGLFQTVNGHSYYLHDGRARNLEEAILWHGGEAETARHNFMNLDKLERDKLLRFLSSL